MKSRLERVEIFPQEADPNGPLFQVWYSEIVYMRQPQPHEYKSLLRRLNWEIEKEGENKFRTDLRALLRAFQPGQTVNSHWIVDKDGAHWKGGILTTLAELPEPPPTSPFKNFEI